MGVIPRLRELSYQVDEACFVDDSGKHRARLKYARFERTVHGRLLIIMRPDQELTLRERVIGKADLRSGCSIAHIENTADRMRVTLTDETVLDADLLVGADGIHSTVRRMVFGDEKQFTRHLGYHTVAHVFEDPQIFEFARNRFCLTDTIGRQMEFYSLRSGIFIVGLGRPASSRTVPTHFRGVLRPGGSDRDSPSFVSFEPARSVPGGAGPVPCSHSSPR